MITKELVFEALKEVQYPKVGRDIVELGFVRQISVEDQGEVKIKVTLPIPACSLREEIIREIRSTIKALDVEKVDIEATTEIPSAPLIRTEGIKKVKNVIAVGSGKGGVGKSTVAVQLALALSRFGAKVGVLDADIYGASVPLMLGPQLPPDVIESRIKPASVQGIEMISMAFFVPENAPVIWRGPLVAKAVDDFLNLVDWGELDYLIVDLPPGTGDAPLTLAQKVSLTGVIIVSTPQKAALEVAIKAYHMFKKLDIPILGMVENMSYITCPHCGINIDIFGSGGVEAVSKKLKVPFLGSVPIDPKLRELEDKGLPAIDLIDVKGEFLKIAENLALNVSVVNLTATKKGGGRDFFLPISGKRS